MSQLFKVFLLTFCLNVSVFAQHLTLDQCLAYAQEHNAELLTKSSTLRSSELAKKSAKAGLLPKVTGNAAIDHYWKIPVQVFPGQLLGQPEGSFVPVRLGTPWMGSFGLEAELSLINASAWQQVRLSTLEAQLATSEWELVKKELLKRVKMAYLAAQLVNQNLGNIQEQLLSYQQCHRVISLQFEKGLTDKITLNQSASTVQNLQDNLGKAESELALALLDLKFWMGYPMQEPILIGLVSLPLLADSITFSFNIDLLPENQVRALERDVLTRQHAASLSQRYPKLSLASGYSKLGFGQKVDFIGSSQWFSSGYVGLKLAVPILDLNSQLYGPRKQKALLQTRDLEELEYQSRQQQIWFREEIQWKEALNSVRLHQQRLALAKQNHELSLKKLEKGIINAIELKQVQDELTQVQEKLSAASLQYIRHQVELDHLHSN